MLNCGRATSRCLLLLTTVDTICVILYIVVVGVVGEDDDAVQ